MRSSLAIVDQIVNLCSAIISIVLMGTITTLHPVIIFVVAVVVFVNSRATKWLNGKQFEINKELSFFARFMLTATTMISGFYFVKENRLFDMFPLLIEKYKKKSREEFKIQKKLQIAQIQANLIPILTGLIQNVVIYTYLIYSVLKNRILIGNLTIYISAAGQFSGALSSVVSSYLGIGRTSLYVLDMMKFMNLPLKQHSSGHRVPTFDRDSFIDFKNVSFKYPGTDRYVLKNINLTLHGNEKLCIVGSNGSGKTTFIKLLVRLCFPTEGEILLNGINVNEYDYQKYLKLFSPVFQDFYLYYQP